MAERSLRISLDTNIAQGAQQLGQALRDIGAASNVMSKSVADTNAILRTTQATIGILTVDANKGEEAIRKAQTSLRQAQSAYQSLSEGGKAVSVVEREASEKAISSAEARVKAIKDQQDALKQLITVYQQLEALQSTASKSGINSASVNPAALQASLTALRRETGSPEAVAAGKAAITIAELKAAQTAYNSLMGIVEKEAQAEVKANQVHEQTAQATQKMSQATQVAAQAAVTLDKSASLRAQKLIDESVSITLTSEKYRIYIAALEATAKTMGTTTSAGRLLTEVIKKIQEQSTVAGGFTTLPGVAAVTQAARGAPDIAFGKQAEKYNAVLLEVQKLIRGLTLLNSELEDTPRRGDKPWDRMSLIEKSMRGVSVASGSMVLGLLGVQTQLGIVSAAGQVLQRSIASLSFAVSGLFSFREAAVQIAAFDQALRTIGAAGDLAGEALTDVEKRLRQVGATTQFTAIQAADAYLVLIRAGYGAAEANKALIPTLQLVTAGSLQLSEATEITSKVLKQFNLSINDITKVTDSLITVANKSTTDVRNLGEALKFVGPIAREAGISLEETTALLGVLASRGIDATMAGTVLRNIITQLIDPAARATRVLRELGISESEMAINSNGLVGVLERLSSTNISLEQTANLAQKRSIAGLDILIHNIESIKDLKEATEGAIGTTEKQAQIIGGSLPNSLNRAKAATTELLLATGDRGLKGTLQGIVDGFTLAVRSIAGYNGAQGQMAAGAQSAAVAIKTLSIATATYLALQIGAKIARTAADFLYLKGTVDQVESTTRALNATFAKASPILLGISLGIGALVALWHAVNAESEETRKRNELAAQSLEKVKAHLEAAAAAADEYNKISARRLTAVNAYDIESQKLEKLITLQKELNAAREIGTKQAIAQLPPNQFASQYSALLDRERSLAQYATPRVSKPGDVAEALGRQYLASQYAKTLESINELNKSVQALTSSDQALFDAELAYLRAQAAVSRAIDDYTKGVQGASAATVTFQQIASATGKFGGKDIAEATRAFVTLRSQMMGLGTAAVPTRFTGQDIEQGIILLGQYQAGLVAQAKVTQELNNAEGKEVVTQEALRKILQDINGPRRAELAALKNEAGAREGLVLISKLEEGLRKAGLPISIEEILNSNMSADAKKRLIPLYSQTIDALLKEGQAIGRNIEMVKAQNKTREEQQNALHRLQELMNKTRDAAIRSTSTREESQYEKNIQQFNRLAEAAGLSGFRLNLMRVQFAADTKTALENEAAIKANAEARKEQEAALRKYLNILGDYQRRAQQEAEVSQAARDYGLDLEKAREVVRQVAEARQALDILYKDYPEKEQIIANRTRDVIQAALQDLERQHTEELARDFGQAWANAFDSFVEGTKTAKEAAKDLVLTLEHMILQEVLITPVKNMFAEIFKSAYAYLPSLFSGAGQSNNPYAGQQYGPPIELSARGNIFDYGTITPFRRGGLLGGGGGLITQPTTFEMASGAYGRAAESSTEVIAPLGRDAQGRLGMYVLNGSQSSGPQVVNHNHFEVKVLANNIDEFRGSRKQLLSEITALGNRASRG